MSQLTEEQVEACRAYSAIASRFGHTPYTVEAYCKEPVKGKPGIFPMLVCDACLDICFPGYRSAHGRIHLRRCLQTPFNHLLTAELEG